MEQKPGLQEKKSSVNTVAFISCRHRLRLQLMKATVLTKSSICILSFQRVLPVPAMSTDVSQVDVTLFPSFNIFYHFTFPGFLFILIFVLMGWSLLPNALRPFKIYCAPPTLGITRTWICRLNLLRCLCFQEVILPILNCFWLFMGPLVTVDSTSWSNHSQRNIKIHNKMLHIKGKPGKVQW